MMSLSRSNISEIRFEEVEEMFANDHSSAIAQYHRHPYVLYNPITDLIHPRFNKYKKEQNFELFLLPMKTNKYHC